MSAKSRIIKRDIIYKNIPENTKYKNVRPRVDSGASVRRYLERMQESQRDIKLKRDEVFKRIKLATFVNLVIEVSRETFVDNFREISTPNLPPIKASITPKVPCCKSLPSGRRRQERAQKEDIISNGNEESQKSSPEQRNTPFRVDSALSVDSMRSTFQSVINGIGEMDVKCEMRSLSTTLPKSAIDPYLLLDVRDPDSYRQCHIITAKNYPHSMLLRTCNYESNDLLTFKNVPNKIIVVYDEDESLASRVASTLVQRGYDNIFMLSGGLKLASYRFPTGLITGLLPPSCRQGVGQRSSSLSRLNVRNNTSDTFLPKILKDSFTVEDLQLLQSQLDRNVVSRSSSRCGSERSRTAQSVTRKSPQISRAATAFAKPPGKIQPWK
ncbi:centrosomal protein of 41 kDa A-like [Centruroides sculpturatus]|uniref:centrosomal protein of 41 kDa A-like n=1 Tax=Centruroides sculpturatus TaxID=218467 RepID=UPI000C6D9CB7|nr:centrosomal protein of 41 kDa A-like [Centruroides sculpturatus]